MAEEAVRDLVAEDDAELLVVGAHLQHAREHKDVAALKRKMDGVLFGRIE